MPLLFYLIAAQRAIASRVQLWDIIGASFSQTQNKHQFSLAVLTTDAFSRS